MSADSSSGFCAWTLQRLPESKKQTSQGAIPRRKAFTTRIELIGGGQPEYDLLDRTMRTLGFNSVVESIDGEWYRLPLGEYDLCGRIDVDVVRGRACAAARITGRQFKVLVSQSTRRLWFGLDKCDDE